MATVNGVNFQLTENVPSERVDNNEWHGRVRAMFEVYEASALAAASTIKIGIIPPYSKVVDAMMFWDAMGGTNPTIEMGDSDTTDRLITAQNVQSAGSARLDQIAGFGYEYTTETELLLTTATDAITGTVKTCLLYTLD